MTERDKVYHKFYDELPPPIAERAKRNYVSGWSMGEPYHTAAAISMGFHWGGSPEGSDFWYLVARAASGWRGHPSVKGL